LFCLAILFLIWFLKSLQKNKLRKIGSIIFGIGLAILVLNFYPIFEQEINYQINKNQNNINNQSEINPMDKNFGLIIPKLDINVSVIKNVDPFNSSVYQKALAYGVVHAQGSALPNEIGNVYIFSHSSTNFYEAIRYNSIFYLLDKLDVNDKIYVFYEGQKYEYEVYEKKIVNPKEVKYLKNSLDDYLETLTLQTCYPFGTNLKRLLILSKKI